MQDRVQKILYFNIISFLKNRFTKVDEPFLSAFIVTFLALNLIFLYSGTHFLFGDHDWTYVKDGVKLSAGLFEGRFTQFVLINLLTQGEIYPIINNLLGFLGFSLGISLLARYWQIKHTVFNYIIFALFTAITPYILSFTYFAFIVIPVLSWNAFIIGALLISQKQTAPSLKKSILAILLILFALGGYPPVINLIAVAFTARLFFDYTTQKNTLPSLIGHYRWTIFNILSALIIYKLCLYGLSFSSAFNDQYYNLQTTPLSQWPTKFLLVLKDLWLQFGITLPFISAPYKTIVTLITLLALISVLKIKRNRLTTLFLFFAVFLSALITLFLSTSIKETEFSPRIDFFGFLYALSFCITILLNTKQQLVKNFTLGLVFLSLILNTNTLFEAQKVWHFGFITEMNLYRRVIKRFQSNPLFSPNNHYIIVQGGAPSFRHRFYHTPFNHNSDDLLNISYVPGMASGVMLNYYSKNQYADTTSYVYTFRPDTEIKQKLKQSKPWPHPSSISVGNYWILLPLTEDGLNFLRQKYL